MGVEKPSKIENWDDMNKYIQAQFNNLSLADLKSNDLRETAPTADSLDKTRFAVYDPNGVPAIYYRGRDGNVYKFQGVLA